MNRGFYLPSEGALHRWHPLTKLALIAAAFLVGFADLLRVAGVALLPLLAGVAMALLVAFEGRQAFGVWLRRLVLVLAPIFLSLFLVQGFFYPQAESILFVVGPFSLKLEGVLFAVEVAGRLFVVIGATLLLLMSTQPSDLAVALTGIGIPREVTYLMITAIQLLPRMQDRAGAILDAQRARGLRTEGSIVVRAKALLPLVGPLIGGALLETDERALALEARAFRAPGPKTSLRVLVDTPAQRAARWLLVGGAAALLVWSLVV